MKSLLITPLTIRKLFILFTLSLLVVACDVQKDTEPEIQDEVQEMLEVMKFTAQVVSRVTANNQARREILSYALPEFDGEVTADFSKLLLGSSEASNSANGIVTGGFSKLFRPMASQFQTESTNKRSLSVNNIISDLESYLKKHNMAIYGPYLAENHSNSTKPITVTFNPLDESKKTNIGYMFVPKTSSSVNTDNIDGLDTTINYDDYHLVEVANVDDDYAYNNPVLAVIPNPDVKYNPPPTTSEITPEPRHNNGINCEDLLANDILRPSIARFRLLGNLRGAPWNRNLLTMYVVTKDDIGFDANNNAQINPTVTKIWNKFRVSRKNARQKTWLDANRLLDSNWKIDESNLFLAVTYKHIKTQISEITAKVTGVFTGTLSGEVSATFRVEKNQNLLFAFPHDKCITTSLYKTASFGGLEQGRRVEKGGGKMEYTFNIEWYR